MKPIRLILTFTLAGAAGLMAAEAQQTPPARVSVNFIEPEKFTDVRDGNLETEKGRNAILQEIREFIVQRAEKVLPAGQRLEMTFTDIDLAGDFEPWRGPRLDDVRIVKDIYPPRLKFGFRITDEAGNVIKQGSKDLRDLAFQTRLTINRQDSLHYEKDILNDWLRSEVREKS